MENIIIKGIDEKPSGLVIVKYNGNREATMNVKWQRDDVDYMKSLGIGGEVGVEIVKKGEYINITKIERLTKTTNPTATTTTCTSNQFNNDGNSKYGLMCVKDVSIVSQCLTKAWASTQVTNDKITPQEILDAYNFFVLALENGE